MSTTKFAYFHTPSQKWCKIDSLYREIFIVDRVDDCVYNARNIIEEDFSRCTIYTPYYNNLAPSIEKMTVENRKDFVLVPVDVSFNYKLPPTIRKIEYNTFGKREVDNKLVDFLNTLRDDPNLINGIQTKVMAFMHRLNRDIFDLYLQNIDFQFRYTYSPNPAFINRINHLFLKDYKERIKNMKWREPLKCAVNACLMERFREVEKLQNPKINLMPTSAKEILKKNGWFLEYVAGNGIDAEVWRHPNSSRCYPDNIDTDFLLNLNL